MSRTERATINMADGYTRMWNGRRNGVVVTQAGPGIENAFGGIAHAYADSVPILILPGGTVRGRVSADPDFSAPAHYGGVTKWAAQINQSDRVAEFLRRAHTFLRSGRGAPVLLEVPGDVGAEEIGDDAPSSVRWRRCAARATPPTSEPPPPPFSRRGDRSSSPARACFGPKPATS